jgi:hypothetical protein
MLATITSPDCVVHAETDWVMTPYQAKLYLTRNEGKSNFLVLMNGDEVLIFHADDQPWSYMEGERLARQKGYGRFVGLNRDGKKFEGELTGRNAYRPVARRQLAIVA